MNTNPTSDIVTEHVDDIPLLLTQMIQMGLVDLLDTHFPTHGNWNGLSLGWTATIWLTHVLSQADHRLNQVQDWVAKHVQTISVVTGQTIQPLDFADDRLAAILRYLNQDESWQKYEQGQGSRIKFFEKKLYPRKHLIRAYNLEMIMLPD
jgi:transposase